MTSSRDLFNVNPGLAFTYDFLRRSLVEVKDLLFFCRLYYVSDADRAMLFQLLFPDHEVWAEINAGGHSTELQDYLEDQASDAFGDVQGTGAAAQHDESLLAELLKAAEITIAESISQVADKLGKALGTLPTGEANMVFSTLNVMNTKRNSIGDYRARIVRDRSKVKHKVLVILDDSGSMTAPTIQTIADDVVNLSYAVNASLVQVSNSARLHSPGLFNTTDVLRAAEYGGTHYETLVPLLNEDWDEVICIADYDSSLYALTAIGRCKGRIKKVWDVSLVERPTFLSECVAQLADEVQSIVIASRDLTCSW